VKDHDCLKEVAIGSGIKRGPGPGAAMPPIPIGRVVRDVLTTSSKSFIRPTGTMHSPSVAVKVFSSITPGSPPPMTLIACTLISISQGDSGDTGGGMVIAKVSDGQPKPMFFIEPITVRDVVNRPVIAML
jgi:hypothetical protein